MMKKVLVTYVAFAIAVLVGINLFSACGFNAASDEEIMNQYIVEEYGEQCYGELCDENQDDCIDFVVYENGCVRYQTSINRGFYTNHFAE